MADTLAAAPVTDALRIERDLRAFIACRLGHTGLRAHERVARTAVFGRLCLSAPDVEAVERHILDTHGLTLILDDGSTVAGIADRILAGLARREVAHV